MKATVNLKRYIEDCIRTRARRRRLYALLGVLCAAVALGVTCRLMKPAITVTAQPVCGREEHVHGEACLERALVCGLTEGETHTHGEDCYASVLICGLQEHTHDASCYPEELPEATSPAETTEPTIAPEATATAEATEPAETTAPEGTATAEATEPAETAAPEVTEPAETAMPEATATAEVTEPAETAMPALDPIDGPVLLQAGEEGAWEVCAREAERTTYEVTNEQGEVIFAGDVQEGMIRLTIDESGLYLLRVTAQAGEERAVQALNLAVSAGELTGEVSARSLSCFGGDEAAFDLRAQGGVQPLICRAEVWQGEELLFSGETAEELRALTKAIEDVSEITATVVWTDACGQSVQAQASIPCAVRRLETRAEWERTLADVEKTGVWPDDLLAVARSQLGYAESEVNFVVDEKGERRGYTRYGDWYGSDHAGWCAMYISFCLHYADVDADAFPLEANCEKWIRALSRSDLYLPADEYQPLPGDLVFFDWEGDGVADHVGIVESLDETLHTIEGNNHNRVMRVEYAADDRAICGYGLLNRAYEDDLAARSDEVILPEGSAEPTETPAPEESSEPTETPAPEESSEPIETPAPEESSEPTETPVPEESSEPTTDEYARLAQRIEALKDMTTEGEEAAAQYETALQETLGAVLSAQEGGAVTGEEATRLLQALVERQIGGETARFAALQETIRGLTQPASDASAEEQVEYDAMLSALREQMAGAYQAGEITKCEYSLLQSLLEHLPECPVQCVYTALDGALRVVHAERGELGGEVLTASTPEEAETARYLQELSALLALENRGAIAQAQLLEIGFTGEGGADVTLRLTDEVAGGEGVQVAHRGEDGWQWLESERLTGEDGAAYVTFRAESFSPFAVLCLGETPAEDVSLSEYCASRGGEWTLALLDAQGEPLAAEEDGAYRVQEGEEYTLRLSCRVEGGFHAGAYVFTLPERAALLDASGMVWPEAPEQGAWQTDPDSRSVRLALTAPVGEAGLALDLPLTFVSGDEPIELGAGVRVWCAGQPILGESGDGSTLSEIEARGFPTYWSDKQRAEEASATRSVLRAPMASVQAGNEPSDVQVVDRGGARGDLNSDGVTVSKTIAGTELENVFDITLTVSTTTSLEEIYDKPDMAVVIVMDISNTMVESRMGGITRYEAAMQAAEGFLDSFASNASANSRIGYVAFNTHAHEIFALQSCSSANAWSLKNQMRTATWQIVGRSGYNAAHDRFTNIEAGLKMGADMLSQAANKNKYIVFLSDGFPTTYISSGYSGYDPYCTGGQVGADGVFYDMKQGKYCMYGTSYSDKAAIRAREMATRIKNNGVEIFSIGVDVGAQKIITYHNQTINGAAHSVVDRMVTGSNYEIGGENDEEAYKNWLKYSIGSGYYHNSTDADGLKDAYNKIFAQIKGEIEQGAEAMWVTNDPLPTVGTSRFVEFIDFFDQGGALRGELLGSNTQGGENTARFEQGEAAIRWDLKKSGYTTAQSGGTTIYSYTLTYRVRLKNEDGAFKEGAVYPTNDTTTLTYQVVEKRDQQTSFSEKRTIDYPIPSVKGYLAELRFRKTDANGLAVPGAVFTLAHDTERCGACRGDGSSRVAIGAFTATSDAEGGVRFERIPSGHCYTLTETVVPVGYRATGEEFHVQVAYDVPTVTVTAPDGSTTVWTGDGNDALVNIGLPRLPETGGTGRLPYAIGGIALMAVSLLCGRALRRRGERGADR